MMKVCVLTHVYPRFKNDPMLPFIEAVSENLQKQGIDVTVLTPDHPKFARTADHTVDLQVYRYIFPRRWHLLGYSNTLVNDCKLKKHVYLLAPLMFLFGMVRLFRLHRRRRFDLLHAHWLLPNGFIAAVVSRVCRVPLVITFHGSDTFISQQNPLFRDMAKWALRQAASITSNSLESKHFLQEMEIDQKKLHIIPTGVELELFENVPNQAVASLREKLHFGESDHVVFALGRIVWKKGFNYLIRAIPQVLEQIPNLKVVIGGDGSELAALKQLVKKLGLESVVRFPGVIGRKEVPAYFYLCDVFVMPAVHDPLGNVDGCPTVVPEAMACGKPVVASNLAGIPLVVSHEENGLLVEEKDVDQLAVAITRLLAKKLLREQFGRASRDKVNRYLTWPLVAQRFLAVYQSVLGSL